jgi:uncharacterized protein YfaS (alpha-2-macroglobulin family)
VRKFDLEGFQKSPYKTGTIFVQDSQRNAFKEIEVTLDENSNFNGEFVLPEDIDLGVFSIRLFTQNNRNVNGVQTFYVEEYVKPTFKITTTTKKADLLP